MHRERRVDEPRAPQPAAASAAEDELRARFATRVERFTHAGFVLELLIPESAEALIDEAEFEHDERLPYWAELWPSARALARHLLDAPPRAKRALELGCGVALPSLVLHARGADVLATDYYLDALRFAEVNAIRNRLPPLTTAPLDWRAVPAGFARFDLVLLADALYERRNAEALAAALPRLVAHGGRVLLADPGRAFLSDFRGAVAENWNVRELETRVEVSDAASGAVSRVVILELVRAG